MISLFKQISRAVPAMPSLEKGLGILVVVLLLAIVIGFLYFKGVVAVKESAVTSADAKAAKVQSEKDALDLENTILQATTDELVNEARKAKEAEMKRREIFEKLAAENKKNSVALSSAKSEIERLKNQPGTKEYDFLNQKLPDAVIDIVNGNTPGL